MEKADQLVSELYTIDLPSKGLLYDGKVSEGQVKIRPMTTREEKLLLSTKRSRDTLMYDVAASCIVEPKKGELALDEYLVGDVIFAFLGIRAATYGPEYSFQPSCRYCNAPITIDVSIPQDLGLYMFNEDFKEPFFVELPKSGKKLGLKLFRVKDEKAVMSFAKRHPATSHDDPAYSYRIARHVVSVDGDDVKDAREIMDLVDGMHAADVEALRDRIIDEDCGVDLQLDRECASCNRMNEIFFEFTPDFFRSKPSDVRRRRRTLR